MPQEWADAALHARLTPFRRKVDNRVEAISRALERTPGFVLCSGGKDSMALAAVAKAADPAVPLVFIDGGMDYPGHVDWFHAECDRLGWELHVIPTEVPLLDNLIASGDWDHATPDGDVDDFHELANLAPTRLARQQFGNLQILGLRADESGVRAASLARFGEWRRFGPNVASFSPLMRWTRRDVWACLHLFGVGRSPVYDRLDEIGCPPIGQRVGHMVTADAVGYGRMRWLRVGWPEEFERLATVVPRIREFA